MCVLCVKMTKFGEVLPGYTLVRAEEDALGYSLQRGQWALVRGDMLIASWWVEPRPDPYDGWTDEAIAADTDPARRAADRLFRPGKFATEFRASLADLFTAYELGSEAVGAGYDRVRDGMLEPWLYARMGALLAQHGPT